MNYYLKRVLNKRSTWAALLLHFLFLAWFYFTIEISPSQFTGDNDFLRLAFWWGMVVPILLWTAFISPLSYIFWWQIDDIAQQTEKDGTDLFFLSTSIPTSRKRIFWGKFIFLTGFLTALYFTTFALPYSLILWKNNYFVNFTSSQTGLFLCWNLLVFPLLFFFPLIALLFSLASLGSVWYLILKWLGRLSIVILGVAGFLVARQVFTGEKSKIAETIINAFNWLDKNYLLVILVIVDGVVLLALFTLPLTYEKFQRKDLN